MELTTLRIKEDQILVDPEDLALVSQKSWYVRMDKRVFTKILVNGHRRNLFIHRFIMNASLDEEVDHINRDPLDNRKSNLRLCKRWQNEMNKPPRVDNLLGLKGVQPSLKKWRARIKWQKKNINLGTFPTKEEAARAYNEKAKELYGEFAWLNPV